MPPRKSNASAVSATGDEGAGASTSAPPSAKKGGDKEKEKDEPVIEVRSIPLRLRSAMKR